MKEIALHILDILQNSIRADATKIRLDIRESKKENLIEIKISDNGIGMDEDILSKVTDPYTTSRITRKVGLGIPLLKYHAEICGGGLKIDSIKGKGTTLIVNFELNHIDRQPMGDIPGIIRIMLSAAGKHSFYYSHQTDKGEFEISDMEIKEAFGAGYINDNQLLYEIKILVKENLTAIGSELN